MAVMGCTTLGCALEGDLETSQEASNLDLGGIDIDFAHRVGDHGWVWASRPHADKEHVPPPSFWFNSGGGLVRVNRSGLGRYEVTFQGIGGAGGNAHVTAYGQDDRYCKVRNWGSAGADQRVRVRCFDSHGALADAPFVALFQREDWSSGVPVGEGRTGYLWSGSSKGGSVPASYAWNDTGASNSVERLSEGYYKARLPGLKGPGASVLVTSYGYGPEYCKLSAFFGGSVYVRCFAPDGGAADSRFSLSYGHRRLPGLGQQNRGAYAWASDASASDYLPSTTYQLNELAGDAQDSIRIRRLGRGRYRVTLPHAEPFNSDMALVTAYGSDATRCRLRSWARRSDETAVYVGCTGPDGAAADSRFAFTYVGNDNTTAPPEGVGMPGLVDPSDTFAVQIEALGDLQLALPMDDDLDAILPSTVDEVEGEGEPYLVFEFPEAGIMENASMRRMSTSLYLDDPSRRGSLTTVAFHDDGLPLANDAGEPWFEHFYRDGAGNHSKIILAPSGAGLGTITINREQGDYTVALDLDADRRVDVVDIMLGDGREIIIVNEIGGEFWDAWLAGENPLCDIAIGTPADEPSFGIGVGADKRAVYPGCAVGHSGLRGGGPGISVDEQTGEDPDALCDDINSTTSGARAGVNPSIVAQDNYGECANRCDRDFGLCMAGCAGGGAVTGSIPATVICGIVCSGRWITCHSDCKEDHPYVGAAEVNDEALVDTNDDGKADAVDFNGDGIPDASCDPCGGGGGGDGGAVSQPGIGPDGTPTDDGMQRLAEMCQRRAENAWPDSFEDMYHNATDNHCDDPFVNPNPAAGDGEVVELCNDADRVSPGDLVDELLGDAGGQSCPLASPTPDGELTCPGIVGGSNGVQVAYGLADVLGITLCRGLAGGCDPDSY